MALSTLTTQSNLLPLAVLKVLQHGWWAASTTLLGTTVFSIMSIKMELWQQLQDNLLLPVDNKVLLLTSNNSNIQLLMLMELNTEFTTMELWPQQLELSLPLVVLQASKPTSIQLHTKLHKQEMRITESTPMDLFSPLKVYSWLLEASRAWQSTLNLLNIKLSPMEELNITFTRMVLSLIAKESSLLWVESMDLRHLFKVLNST